MGLDKGYTLVSVADVEFFNPVTGDYLGEGFANTESTLTQEVSTADQRGGYLNALLFSIQHSKNLTVGITSATFKMQYLAFQTGTPLVEAMAGVYEFSECVTFVNGAGKTAKTPVGDVYIRLENGLVKRVTPAGSNIDIGMPEYNGTLTVTYPYNRKVTDLTIDTKTQPLTVKAVMKIHAFTQDGEEACLEITIPRLKFDGAINLSLSADGLSTMAMNGTALEYVTSCGEALYADVKFYPVSEDTSVAVTDIVASPNVYTLSLAGAKTAMANIIGIRPSPYSNVILDNSKVTFKSANQDKVTITEAGLITALQQGDTQITVNYEGLQDIISVNVGA